MNKAEEYFLRNYNCSQSVFASKAEKLGITPDLALKIGSGFGAGMARMQKTCGAVTGAYMALGIKYGSGAHSQEGNDEVYSKIASFNERFISLHGSINCHELVGYDMNTTYGKKQIEKEKVFETKCPNFVKDAADILDDLI